MNNQTSQYPIHFDEGELTITFYFDKHHIRKYAWGSKRHCNAEYELHVILKGGCSVDVEDVQLALDSGQAIVIAPGKYHKPHTALSEFERFSFGFSVSDSPLLAAIRKKVPQCLCFSPSADFLQYCNMYIEECICNHPSKEVAQKALVSLLAVSLLRNLQLITYETLDKEFHHSAERTGIIDNYFERNFAQKNGCAVLAKQLHLSTRQLSRYLKLHYGMGFQEKLIQTRMDQAALLLRTTNQHVQDIMEFVGYNSLTAFYKAFRDTFSMTPQQYRQQKSTGNENKMNE